MVKGTVNKEGLIGIAGGKTLNLILCEGATLNLQKTLYLMGGATLNIYGQNGGTGTLIVKGTAGVCQPGIGIMHNTVGGSASVNIYGGTVTAQTDNGAQPIGTNPELMPYGKVTAVSYTHLDVYKRQPLYNILESSDLNAMVVNARHMKAVPGRKTDVKDAEWIADLLQHGLLQASYIPAKDQRELRELVRYRKSLVGERGRELNRLQKMLEGANIKLSGTVSDINGKSARSILEYLITGVSIDSDKYDEMYEKKVIAHNLKASKEQIIDDLNGVMTPLQRRMMKELLGHLDELNIHIKNLDDEIDNFMKPEEKQAVAVIEDVTGIGHTSAQAIISVIGTDTVSYTHLSKYQCAKKHCISRRYLKRNSAVTILTWQNRPMESMMVFIL